MWPSVGGICSVLYTHVCARARVVYKTIAQLLNLLIYVSSNPLSYECDTMYGVLQTISGGCYVFESANFYYRLFLEKVRSGGRGFSY